MAASADARQAWTTSGMAVASPTRARLMANNAPCASHPCISSATSRPPKVTMRWALSGLQGKEKLSPPKGAWRQLSAGLHAVKAKAAGKSQRLTGAKALTSGRQTLW